MMPSGNQTIGPIRDQIAKAAAAKDADGSYMFSFAAIAKRYEVHVATVSSIVRDGNACWINHLRWKDDALNRP